MHSHHQRALLTSLHLHPDLPTKIMGKGITSSNNLTDYLLRNNPKLSSSYARSIAKIYIQESRKEGVNHDIAFVQMCHETNFLKYGGQVQPDQNNFAGLGATDDGAQGARFPSPRIGIRAQIQHLKVYGSHKPIQTALVDPRHHKVTPGEAPTVFDLTKRWASDQLYAEKVLTKLQALYRLSNHI